MNDNDESFPSMETRKTKRCYGFRFSSKKVLEFSRLTRRIAKAGGCEFTSITRTLLYPNTIPSELCVTDIHGCTATSYESPMFESVDDLKLRKRR